MNIGKKTSGHNYFNDATWEVAVVLSNDAKNFETINRLCKGGPATGAMVESQFSSLLKTRSFSSLPEGDIHWDEVAAEFNELAGIEVTDKAVAAPPQKSLGHSTEVAVPARAIDQDVIEVLSKCTTEERVVFLPQIRLERKLYERVNAVLEDLGGKWNRKLQGHIFESDPRDALDLAVMTGSYIRPKDFSFFPTPADLAEQLVMLAGLGPASSRDLKILEPSAGQGSIADAASRWVGREAVDTVELLEPNVERLRAKGYKVQHGDFLSLPPQPVYDLVLMNPPFGNQADMKHIEHASRFLRPDGRLLAIMSPSFQFRSTKQAEDFRSLLAAAGSVRREVEAGAFRESGTMVRTVIVEIDAQRLPWNQAARRHQKAGERLVVEGVDAAEFGEQPAQRERMRA